MRKALLFIVGIAIVGLVVLLFSRQKAHAIVGNLDIYTGSARIVRETRTIEGQTGTALERSDVIRVPQGSRVQILLRDGSRFRLDGGTEVRVTDLFYENGLLKQAHIEIREGKIWWDTEPLAQGGSVEVETPSLVATIRGTSFGVALTGSSSDIYVSTHAVAVWLKIDPKNPLTIPEKHSLHLNQSSLRADFARGALPLSGVEKSEWILFNEEEDGGIVSNEDASSVSSQSSAASVPPPSSSSRAVSSAKSSSAQSSAQPSSVSAPKPAKTISSIVLRSEREFLGIGEHVRFSVTEIYSDGSEVRTNAVAWNIQPSGAGSVDALGVFEAKEPGRVIVTVSDGGVTSNPITLMVSETSLQPSTAPAPQKEPAPEPPPPTLQRIGVTYEKHPPTNTAAYQMTADFFATGYYSDGTTVDLTQQVKWSVYGTAKGSVSPSGFYQSSGQGSDTVTAASGDMVGSTTITVP